MNFPKPLNYVSPPPDETWDFLTHIAWFSSEGISANLNSANEAMKSYDWEDFTLERRNDITSSLAKRHPNKETEWNRVTVGYRNFYQEKIEPQVSEAASKVGLCEETMDTVSWCVLAYMMEVTYESWKIPKFFYKLTDSFKEGRLPYAWDGDYPNGNLKEY